MPVSEKPLSAAWTCTQSQRQQYIGKLCEGLDQVRFTTHINKLRQACGATAEASSFVPFPAPAIAETVPGCL